MRIQRHYFLFLREQNRQSQFRLIRKNRSFFFKIVSIFVVFVQAGGRIRSVLSRRPQVIELGFRVNLTVLLCLILYIPFHIHHADVTSILINLVMTACYDMSSFQLYPPTLKALLKIAIGQYD